MYLSPRATSNDQVDFFTFLMECIANGYLVDGDTLVLDNAPIHGGEVTIEEIM